MRIRRLGQAGRVVAPWARAWALAVAVLAAAALVADATAAASDPLERLGARSTEVFTQTRIDGHAVRTRALRFDEPAEAVLAALATAWRTSSPAVVRAQAGGWLIASRMTDAGFETVQLRDADGGSQGFVTLWGRREDESVPLPDWLHDLDEPVPTDWAVRPATRISQMQVVLAAGGRVYRLKSQPAVTPPHWSSEATLYPSMF